MNRYSLIGVPEADLGSALAGLIREYYPNGGEFGRGPQVEKAQLPSLSAALASMGFVPYVFDPRKGDEFGEAFPVYGNSGGITTSALRIWTRESSGKNECIVIEHLNYKGL